VTTPRKSTAKKATKKTTAKKTAKTATPHNLRVVPDEDAPVSGPAFEQVHRTGEDERQPGEFEQVPLPYDDEGRGSHD
jgi:hypothetical protein